MARNKLAGKHPSYKKRNMSEKARKNKLEYDKKFAASTKQKKKRAECNKKRRDAKKSGDNISGKDYDHSVGGFVKRAINRGRKQKSRLKGYNKK